MKSVLLLIAILILNSAFVFAQSQTTDIPTSLPPDEPQKVRSGIRRDQKRQNSAESIANNGRRTGDSGQNINFIRRSSLPFKASINKEQRQRLQPDTQLISKYESFLRQPRTGMIKLFPDAGCEDNANIVRVDARCANWIPNSAFYSFREKEYTVDYLSDITYKNGFLVTDGILAQGILAAIGDVGLENVSLSTGGVKFLIDYQPAVDAREALKQFIEIGKGVKIDSYEYRKAVSAVENMTYALRVIAYRGNFYSAYRGRLFDVLYGDERVDLILAIRILKKNPDDSIILLWKEIAREKSPKVVFPKREKKTPRPGIR